MQGEETPKMIESQGKDYFIFCEVFPQKSWKFYHLVIILVPLLTQFPIYFLEFRAVCIIYECSTIFFFLFYVNGHCFRLEKRYTVITRNVYFNLSNNLKYQKFFAQLLCLKTVKMCFDTKNWCDGEPSI